MSVCRSTCTPAEADLRIPVTVLTGFLGSGKTTFVNYVLKERHGQRIAVVENEFGEVGIDDGLVLQTNEEIIQMMNGCICCTVREDLIEALKNLATTRRSQFDAVIIETTGLADPAPVAQTFFVDKEIREFYRLDAIVTFVDCFHIIQHLDDIKPEGVENEAVEQVAFADVMVLNKTDLVDEHSITNVRQRLKAINATARVMECQHSLVPLDSVLDIHAFDLDKTLAMDTEFLNTEGEHMHDSSVTSVGFVIQGEMWYRKLHAWLDELLANKGQDLFRSKGVLAIKGSDDKYVFQVIPPSNPEIAANYLEILFVVLKLMDLHGRHAVIQAVHMVKNMSSSKELGMNLPPWQPGEKRINRLCFIGRNLDRKALEDSLRACVFDGKVPDPGPVPSTELRFSVGTKVEIKDLSLGTWLPAVVVKQWYREELWEPGRYAPYQVEATDEGGVFLTFVHKDRPALVRLPTEGWV